MVRDEFANFHEGVGAMVHKVTILRLDESVVSTGPLTEPLPKEDQIIEALWANATIKAKVIHIDTPPDHTGWVIAREVK